MQDEQKIEETQEVQATQKKNRLLLVLLIGLVVIIGGAYVLYANLSDKVESNQLSAKGNVTTENTAEKDSAADTTEQGTANPSTADTAEDNAAATAEDDTADTSEYAAPDITIFDADGNEVKLSDFRGKPVILNFWASWCGPCKSEMPDFNNAYLQYGIKIHFLMVNMTDGYSETQSSGQQFIDGQGYVFPVYFDLEQDAAVTYGVSAIPTTYFLDAEGNFVAQASGALDAETLQKGIDMILQ